MNDDTRPVVRVEITKRIASILLGRPPVNAFNVDLRKGLIEALAGAEENPDVDGIVIIGANKTFSAGSDIKEFNAVPPIHTSVDLLKTLEQTRKPLVAAIEGVAFGGGLEYALACHYRVATTGSLLGLPEVKLGLMPGGGGTQRLPRLVGFKKAFEMIFRGDPISGEDALAFGLIDDLFGADLHDRAISFIEERIDSPLPRLRNKNQHIEKARADRLSFDKELETWVRKARTPRAAQAIASAARAAADLSFGEGLAKERELFIALRDGDESKAHRYLFFAEREAAKGPKGERTSPAPISKVAIVGAGTMGVGIAIAAANANIPVAVIDDSRAALENALAVAERTYERMVERGTLETVEATQRFRLIQPAGTLDAASTADIVIEAVFEDLTLKKTIFGRLDRIVRPGAILATNTSTLDVDAIAASTERPGDVIGMHFFSPAHVMRLLEIAKGAETSTDVVRTAIAFGRKLGKTPVVVGVCDGFVGNRMHLRRGANVERLLQEGALPVDIDRAAVGFGFAMGPCQTSDLAGLDVAWQIRRAKGILYPIADALCELGRLGQKTGAGYYKYEPSSRKPISDPEVADLIARTTPKRRHTQRRISDDEINERLLLPIINEGARILDEGIARCASDIDVIWANGYGWPQWRGGPMYYADHLGLDYVRERLLHYADILSDKSMKPAVLLDHLASSDRTLSAYSGTGRPDQAVVP